MKLLRPTIPSTIEIRQRIDTSCAKVLADASQIHEVIVNLCTNAYQAIEETGGILTIALQQVEVDRATANIFPYLEEADYVRLSISDTGTGMDEATQNRIFEPFFTTKAPGKGTGMGLSVVHGIVRRHQGDIMVSSEPGKGSTFHVYLPTTKVEQKGDKKEPTVIEGGHESILVVDDEEAITKIIKKILERLGYKVDACNGSIEALKVFRMQPSRYDLVISDLTMPDMTGLDLAKQLHKIEKDVPVVIMTGYDENLSVEILEKSGIQKIIGKPIRLNTLAAIIRMVLDK